MMWMFLPDILAYAHWPGQLKLNAAKDNVPSGTPFRFVVGLIAGKRTSGETKPFGRRRNRAIIHPPSSYNSL
jgi:hypothetical protein